MATTSALMKTVIVTGASAGLGLATAKKLCQDGFDVIFACRNLNKGQDAMDTVVQEVPSATPTLLQLDLADLDTIPAFVASFKLLEKNLYALVNNAGMTHRFEDKTRVLSKDGFELTLATNYIGHFLLTNLLLDDLKAGTQVFGEARVVSLASSLHDPDNLKRWSEKMTITELELDNLNLEKEGTFSGIQAYKNSKAAQIMFTYELGRKLEGSGVYTSCLCPGFVPATDMGRENNLVVRSMLKYVVPVISYVTRKNFVTSVEDATKKICKMVTDPDLKGKTGLYYQNGEPGESKGTTNDVELQKNLWDHTVKLVKLT